MKAQAKVSKEELQEWMVDNLARVDLKYRNAMLLGAEIASMTIENKIEIEVSTTMMIYLSGSVGEDFSQVTSDTMKVFGKIAECVSNEG